MQKSIEILPLTIENFAPFGEVISCDGRHDFFHINNAHTERYDALVETTVKGDAHIGISIFRNIKSTPIPFEISMLEKHPNGSQAFIPMQGQKILIIVALALDENTPDLTTLCAFISNGSQGVNYRASTWHHPLLSLEAPSDFAVIDRIGTGHNCDVYTFPEKVQITTSQTKIEKI